MGILDGLGPSVASVLDSFGTTGTRKVAGKAVFDPVTGRSYATPTEIAVKVAVVGREVKRAEDGTEVALVKTITSYEFNAGDELVLGGVTYRVHDVRPIQGTDDILAREVDLIR